MRLIDNDIVLSATDLANHQRCERLVQLDRRQALEIAAGAAPPEEKPSLAAQKGIEHERVMVDAEIAAAQSQGLSVLDLRGDGVRDKRQALKDGIRAGIDLIIQAPLRAGTMGGWADLLVRVEDGEEPAGTLATRHRYEPVEIKYARNERPAFVLQVCAYAAALTELCGEEPRALHVWTYGRKRTYATVEFMAHYRAALVRLEAAVAREIDAELATTPAKIGHCTGCSWSVHCDERRLAVDHLSQVAGIRRDQITKLAEYGIETMAALADATVDEVSGIGAPTLERLRNQARMQHDQRSAAPGRAWMFRQPDGAGRGFARLPQPDAADMFFDFEGYPYHEAGAFEYLWGWSTVEPGGGAEPRFDHIWCDTEAEERAAFERFLALVTQRRIEHPSMHVYHYAPYEITQLNRLADKHPDLAEPLWPLLSDGVFVDLYAVVHQSMTIGVASYSIKKLEPLYGRSRSGDAVDNAADSIEQYEEWLALQDPATKREILAYNQVDCESTIELRDWLLQRRAEAAVEGIEWPHAPQDPKVQPRTFTDEQLEAHAQRASALEILEAAARGVLPAACAQFDASLREDTAAAAKLLAALPGWQAREDAQFFGELHGSAPTATAAGFIDVAEAMGSLEFGETIDIKRGSMLRVFHGPPQDSLAKVGDVAYDPIAVRKLGCIQEIDPETGRIAIKTTKSEQAHIDRFGGVDWSAVVAILGRTEISVSQLEARAGGACLDFASALRAGRDPFTTAGLHRTAATLLAGRAPLPTGHTAGAPLLEGPPTPQNLADLIERLDHETLVVQGPPGTGKTWMSARVIAQLVARGLRVGITSNGHDAIRNLVCALDRHLAEPTAPSGARGLQVAYSPGTKGSWDGAPDRVSCMSSKEARAAVQGGSAQIVAGTAWLYAGCDAELDVVFVDEAGQLGLLHTTAVASAATRLVLVGDPQQLAQPSPATHPNGADQSPLDLMFEGADTLPPDRGVLLPVTRRMHPAVSGWVSDAFYDGLVEPHGPTAHHAIHVPGAPQLSGSGLRLRPVTHTSCATMAPAEAEVIAKLVRELTDGGTYVDHDDDGLPTPPQPITLEDILIVAPYNRQVACLRAALPDGARVGTVDKFQGQEAPVAIWSVTASSSEDVPRGLDFLLSPNRMNVAISRARALAILVGSPALLATRCKTVEEMRLVNRLQLFAERATALDV